MSRWKDENNPIVSIRYQQVQLSAFWGEKHGSKVQVFRFTAKEMCSCFGYVMIMYAYEKALNSYI